MPKGLQISVWDLISPLVRTFDMMSPRLAEHSSRVGYLAMRLAEELGLPPEERREIALAGALHDIGAFSLKERLDLLDFEETKPTQHARAGSLLLRGFEPFKAAASIVEFHHLPWDGGAGARHEGRDVPRGSHVIHLADRAAVLVSEESEVLGQVSGICEAVSRRRGEVFVPEFVDALLRLAEKDYVWLDLASEAAGTGLREALGSRDVEVGSEALLELARLICRVIDFKSEFTATHSSGVAATGKELARLVGFSSQECTSFEIAAYLHDAGKLAVPSEILEKPGRLTAQEWDVMRTHVYHTYQMLSPIEALGVITPWGALHQERLNGSGYPFGFTADAIPLGARVMAVADVFTGITENRPYRKGMSREEATGVLRQMVERNELDGRIVGLLLASYEELNTIRAEAQSQAIHEYETFQAALG